MKSFIFLLSLVIGVGAAFLLYTNVYAVNIEVLPDLVTVVPSHVQLVNSHQKEIIRFSNGIANTGDGYWQMRPEFPLDDPSTPQKAFQMILDQNGNVAREVQVGQFEYHPTHHHWHVADVALFSVHTGSPSGPIFSQTLKTSFCLLDLYKMDDNSPTTERAYWDCLSGYQGVSPGWVDQYHQSTDGQQVDITGAPAGIYYFVSETNPSKIFIEENTDNNISWVKFELTRSSNGNAKIAILDHSPCDTPALCGEASTNR
ncbi:MAG: lysyl oxidase family protein [Candidatus Nitrosotenuis sp.]